jgi:hypothetical protein
MFHFFINNFTNENISLLMLKTISLCTSPNHLETGFNVSFKWYLHLQLKRKKNPVPCFVPP